MGEDGQQRQHDGGRWSPTIRGKETRKMRARRGENRSIWFWMGMMGLVGWSVSVPTLIGLAVGWWLDRHLTGQISWTLTGLVVGTAAGCVSAWYWVKRESERR